MKINKKQVEDILDLVWDWTDYEIEGNAHYGYDITPSLNKDMKKELGKEITKIIAPKRRPLWNILKKS